MSKTIFTDKPSEEEISDLKEKASQDIPKAVEIVFEFYNMLREALREKNNRINAYNKISPYYN